MYGGSTIAEDKRLFLSLRTLPARLEGQEAGWLLGFNREEISVLTCAGLLKALGKPAEKAPKYFSLSEIREKASDSKWLDRATIAISAVWRDKNIQRLSKKSLSRESQRSKASSLP